MEFVKSVITSPVFISIVSAIVIFILNEWIKQLWLFPLSEYKNMKKTVAYALTMYAHRYANPLLTTDTDITDDVRKSYEVASAELREVASEVRAFVETVYIIRPFIPSPKRILAASQELIGLSNGLYMTPNEGRDTIGFNLEAVKQIRKSLGIKSGISSV